jgi:hypothetical protein
MASSAVAVGHFWLRKLSEWVIQDDFNRCIRFETVGLFHRQMRWPTTGGLLRNFR